MRKVARVVICDVTKRGEPDEITVTRSDDGYIRCGGGIAKLLRLQVLQRRERATTVPAPRC
jgi:hypothetical protein